MWGMVMIGPQSLSPRTRRLFPHRFVAWQRRSLSARAAGALASAGCDTLEDVAYLGRSYSEGRRSCAAKTVSELAILAGWPPKPRTAIDTIVQAPGLAIDDPEEASEAAANLGRRYWATVPFSRRSGALRRPPSGSRRAGVGKRQEPCSSTGPVSLKHKDAAPHV
jgi:hypothetical protein